MNRFHVRCGFTLIEVLSALLIGSLVMGMAGQFLHAARQQMYPLQAALTRQETARILVLQVRAGLMRQGTWHCPGRAGISGWHAAAAGGWRPGPGLDPLHEHMPLPRDGTDVLLVGNPSSASACVTDGETDRHPVVYFIADNAGGEPALFRRVLSPERSPRLELSPGVPALAFRYGLQGTSGGLRWYSAEKLPPETSPQLLEMRFVVNGPGDGLRRFQVTLPADGAGWAGGAL